MNLAAGIVLLALQLGDSYLDPGAEQLVKAGRDRREAVEARIERYEVLVRNRLTVGIRAVRRDRTLYRCEAAAQVHWGRADTVRVDLVGSREALPMFLKEPQPSGDDCLGSFFDPTADPLSVALGDGIRRRPEGGTSDDDDGMQHPLAEGSERHYRYRSGGTTTLQLADGTTIRLRELQVIPRRSDPTLLRGSLWLEDRTHAVVRAVLRMARAFDYDRDRALVRDEGDDDDDEVPGFLRPLRADLSYVTVEYGLWDQKWWMPRLVAVEGEAEVGRLLKVPVRMERSYEGYTIAELPPDAPIEAPGLAVGNGSCDGDKNETEVEGDGVQVEVAIRSDGRDPVRIERSDCTCSDGRCQVVVTRAAVDSATLVQSEYLPATIFEAEGALFSDAEMRGLLAQVEGIRANPWQLTRISWRAGWQGLDLMRYNRVEGLSLGAAASVDLGGAMVEGSARLGVADLVPNAEVSAWRESARSRQAAAIYGRLNAVGPAPRPFTLGSSLSALFFGIDDADYYRAWGAEVTRTPADGADGLTWRAFAEIQRAARKETDFSLPNTFGDANFRPNIEADAAEQGGAEVQLRGSLGGIDPTGWRATAAVSLLGSTGTFSFAQPRLVLGGALPLPFGLMAGLEAAGGTTLGDAPLQSHYFLGGGRTVRGYDGSVVSGETFWTARAEVATAGPGVRLILFSDAGWAGPEDSFTLDPVLLSAGVGASFMDGLIRFDLARALREVPGGEGWRLVAQVDAGL